MIVNSRSEFQRVEERIEVCKQREKISTQDEDARCGETSTREALLLQK